MTFGTELTDADSADVRGARIMSSLSHGGTVQAPRRSVPVRSQIPDDLAERDQWVVWKCEEREGKPTKVPYQPNNKRASTTDPTTWGPCEEVFEFWQCNQERYAGIGYVFTANDPHVGIDLDNCFDDNGNPRSWACPVIESFGDSYMEISPSGKGVKIFARGKLPAGGKRKDFGNHAIEMYDQGRFFTVTGRAFNGAPLQIEDHQADIEKLYELIAGGPISNGHTRKIEGKIPQGHRHNTLVSLAGTMWSRGMSVDAIDAALWTENCARCEPPYDRQHIRKIAESAAGWQRGTGLPAAPDLLPHLRNDHGNACRLILLHGEDLRYCHAFRKWLKWDGMRWAIDETDQAKRLGKHTMLEFLRQALDRDEDAAKFAKSSLEARRISSMLSMAECEIYLRPDELDRDPYLLNSKTVPSICEPANSVRIAAKITSRS